MEKIIFHATPEEFFIKRIEDVIGKKLEYLFEQSKKEEDRFITREQAAKLIGVVPQTIFNWEKQGKVKSLRVSGSRAVRYRLSDIKQIMKDRDFGCNF